MEQSIKTYINKAEAVQEIIQADLPAGLTNLFLDMVEKTQDDSEVILMPASRDVAVLVFKSTEDIRFIKEIDEAVVQAVTLAGVTTLTILKNRKV